MVHRGQIALPTARSETPVAARVADEYEVKTLVGAGPHGSVWRAVHRRSDQDIAVKVLHRPLAGDAAVRDRLTREYYVLTAFYHPALVRLRDLVLGDEVALVYERVTGSDLRRVGLLAAEPAAAVIADAATALSAAHAEGVVHCGIKPANLLLAKGTRQVRITDARVVRLVRGFHAAAAHLDSRYTAPEVLLGHPAVPATDVYGLGLTWYEMLTGSTPTPHADPARRSALPPQPAGLRQILEACLASEPTDRPTAAELADHLRRALPSADCVEHHDPRVRHASPGVAYAEPARPPSAPPTPTPPAIPPSPAPLRWHRARSVAATAVLFAAAGTAVLHSASSPTGPVASPAGSRAKPAAPTTHPARPARPIPATWPTLPAQPTLPTRQGGSDFVQYWFDVLNYADATGDPAPIVAASEPRCRACAADAEAVRAAYASGGSFDGGRYTVRQIIADGFFNPGDTVVVGVVFDRGPQRLVDGSGAVRAERPGTTFASCQLLLIREGDQWRVAEQLCGSPTP